VVSVSVINNSYVLRYIRTCIHYKIHDLKTTFRELRVLVVFAMFLLLHCSSNNLLRFVPLDFLRDRFLELVETHALIDIK